MHPRLTKSYEEKLAARPQSISSRLTVRAIPAGTSSPGQDHVCALTSSALALCVGIMGSSALGACLRAHIGSFLPALVAFAAMPCDDIGQIIAAVIVGN